MNQDSKYCGRSESDVYDNITQGDLTIPRSREHNLPTEKESVYRPANISPEGLTSSGNSISGRHPEIPRLNLTKAHMEATEDSRVCSSDREMPSRPLSMDLLDTVAEKEGATRYFCDERYGGCYYWDSISQRADGLKEQQEASSRAEPKRLSERSLENDERGIKMSARTSSDADDLEEFEKSMDDLDLSDL